MTKEKLIELNNLNAKIEDRKRYGELLQHELTKQNEYMGDDLLYVRVGFGSNSGVKLEDIDARDVIETAIARNDREIKKLEKQFNSL